MGRILGKEGWNAFSIKVVMIKFDFGKVFTWLVALALVLVLAFPDILPWGGTRIVEVPVETTVYIDSIVKVHDTVFEPVPVYVEKVTIDSTYYKKYLELKDSVQRLELFKETIAINEYSLVYNDSVQDITVNSKVRGDLLWQNVDYDIFPRTVTVTDTVQHVPGNHFSIGPGLGIPWLNNALDPSPVFDLRAGYYIGKSGTMVTGSLDTDGYIRLGGLFKIGK